MRRRTGGWTSRRIGSTSIWSSRGQPRALTADEAKLMVELVDAWRALEHRKHIALKQAREEHAGP
jgi:hypothetical protein